MDDILINIAFCVTFALIPFIVFALLPYAGISLRRFSIPSLFVIYYLAFAYAGSMPLYFGLNQESLPAGIVDRVILLKMFIFSSVALITIISGFIYAHHVIGFNSDVMSRRAALSSSAAQRIFIVFLFFLCGLILLAYIRQIETIALFNAIAGDITGAAKARSEMGNDFQGTYWHYRIFFRQLLDYCVIFFFADYLIKRRRISILAFGGSFLVAVFSATMAIEKGPLVNLLIMLYMTYVIYKGGNYWQSITKYFAIVLLFIISIGYVYFMGAPGITTALQYIPDRVLMGQLAPAYFYLDLFPRQINYLLGASLPNPGGIFPFQNYPLTLEVARFMSPESFMNGVVGSAPTVFWAEMYANFGPTGIIFSSFLIGIGLFAVSHILSKLLLTPPVVAATVSLAMHYIYLTGTSLSNYFFDTTLIAITAVTCISLLISRGGISIRRSMPLTCTDVIHLHAK